MIILLTAFDPFGGESRNASAEILARLEAPAPGVQLVKQILPTQFVLGPQVLEEAIRLHRPDLLLMLGQAGGRSAVTFERVAINCMDARIPDNAGFQPREEAVVAGGPAAYFHTIPLADLVQHLRDRHLPAAISNTAGTFVCNALFYRARHYLESYLPGCRCDFVHIPYLEDQERPVDSPVLSADICAATLQRALECLCGSARLPEND